MSSRAMLAAIALAAIGGSAVAAGKARIVVTDNLAFGQPPAGPAVGDTLQWFNQDTFQHTVTARDGRFDIVLAPKHRANVILRKPGEVAVYCRYHSNMKVTLNITR